MQTTDSSSFAENGKRFITGSCRFFAALCAFAAVMTFIAAIWHAVQTPPLAAIDRAPNVPWYTPLCYLGYAIALYFTPSVLRLLDAREAKKAAT
ncbi:hypothetical protein [Agrobacterium tumefaciens]|uniref:hypothetical protein n=1 Tax=Agrobacterium tumefaciens TaxID=358 RepID=UPI0015743491|nr:hypothetical protein [Agrobacterium tumefaciens]NTB05878.1 hypothetical protein [Agrobacterium tumefaciens]